MKKLLLLSSLFFSLLAVAQNFKTAFDQLMYVNEQWLNQPDVDPDFSGRLVKQYKGSEGNQTLPVGNLSSGSYLLQLTTTGGQVYNQRVVR